MADLQHRRFSHYYSKSRFRDLSPICVSNLQHAHILKPMTPRKSQPKPDDPAQYKRFLEAAREAEADETKEGADRAFKAIASPKGGRSKPAAGGKAE